MPKIALKALPDSAVSQEIPSLNEHHHQLSLGVNN